MMLLLTKHSKHQTQEEVSAIHP